MEKGEERRVEEGEGEGDRGGRRRRRPSASEVFV